MRYSQDDVHAVLMAAATIYGANPADGEQVAVEAATKLLDRARKCLGHQNPQIEDNQAYVIARNNQIVPNNGYRIIGCNIRKD